MQLKACQTASCANAEHFRKESDAGDNLKSQCFASNSDCPEGSPETEPDLLLISTSEEQDQSSDDDYVEQILSMPEKFANLPPFNILDPDTVQRPYTLPVKLSDQFNQDSGQELDTDSGESSSPPPRHSKRLRLKVPSHSDASRQERRQFMQMEGMVETRRCQSQAESMANVVLGSCEGRRGKA